MPLNQHLLASDLRRVSCPASAVALLKGQANLVPLPNCLRLFKRRSGLPQQKKKPPSARGPSGEVRSPPHRLRGGQRPCSISVAARYQIRYRPIGQIKGAGVSPARFCLLFPRWKSRPAEHTQSEGLTISPKSAKKGSPPGLPFSISFTVCPASASGYPPRRRTAPGTPPPAGSGLPRRSGGRSPPDSGWWRAPSSSD